MTSMSSCSKLSVQASCSPTSPLIDAFATRRIILTRMSSTLLCCCRPAALSWQPSPRASSDNFTQARATQYWKLHDYFQSLYLKQHIQYGDATGTVLNLRSTGHGFKSYSGQKLHNNLGQVVHTYVPLSPSSITWSGQGAVMLCSWKGNCKPDGK